MKVALILVVLSSSNEAKKLVGQKLSLEAHRWSVGERIIQRNLFVKVGFNL